MKFIVALCILPFVFGLELQDTWNICEGHPGKIMKVEFEPCGSEPCVVNPGKAYTIKATFEPTHDTASDCHLKGKVLLDGAWFDLLDEPACGANVKCPLKKGETALLTKTIAVSDRLNKGTQTTRWKLFCNSDGDEIFCADLKFNLEK